MVDVDCCWWWRVVPVAMGGGGGLCLCIVVGLGNFFFFFLGCRFSVIVGDDGGVGLIPCDLGCINGVDSSLYLFLFF